MKTLWEKKKLLVTSNFSFSYNVFFSIRYCNPSCPDIFLTSYMYLYLLLNWKSPKLGNEVKGQLLLADAAALVYFKLISFQLFWMIGFCDVSNRNPLPTDKIWDLSNLKAFCRWHFKCRSNDDLCYWLDRKHCGEKEKMLVTSIFSFSHNVFRRPLFQGRWKLWLWGKGLNQYMYFLSLSVLLIGLLSHHLRLFWNCI